MRINHILRDKIDKSLSSFFLEKLYYSIEFNNNLAFGDLYSNVALIYFAKLKDKFRTPRELAQKLAEELQKDEKINQTFSQIKVEGPGFINFWLAPVIVTGFVKKINKDIDSLPKNDNPPSSVSGMTLKRQKIMVEFAHPNTHKQFHLGHLRTLLIGGSLSKLFEETGSQVFRANYQGDIGPHVAKAVYGVIKLLEKRNLKLNDFEKKSVWEKAKFLQEAYIYGNQEYVKNKDEIDELNTKLYQRNPDTLETYNTTREWSLKYFDEIYMIFGVSYDKLFFESETAQCGKEIVLENVGKVFENDNGTIIFPGEKYGLHTRVFVTRDSNPTYEGKDMCLAQKQYEAFPFDLNIHVVAAEQKEYFKVIFKALELIDPKFKNREFHLSMGMVDLASGKMSSRTGDIVTINELLSMVKNEIAKLVGEGRIKEDERQNSIDKITKAAIVYAFLKINPTLNFTFDISKSISLDGDSGPYLLYTYARIKSVINKSKIQIKNKKEKNDLEILAKEDLELARRLCRFHDVVVQSVNAYSPNILANYLYDLAREFNSYYQEVSILKAENQDLISARLDLISAVSKVLKEGLRLLNIEVVERM
ncbi:MAG: arginine--tRNA ligase [Candidatus Levybacteria bacterium RIFCSPHIGHO2_01_FULL_36_15]|nr:MAG: arginine--tRNA ligase [Candidatus Levybacteria bacterium RIFCSPHIGHO2_01_FULL_36_15]OGH36942.1 MAG: arginine--tRNA ligase [Candidatus Levybacteria bacterium RIFCSPLOWO2_01_FULL_36_10]